MRGMTLLKRVVTGEVSLRALWYRIQEKLGSESAAVNFIYATETDPWSYTTSEYEQTKYARTLAALPKARYRRVLEVACSIGVFTMLLAPRVDTLRGIDLSREAVRRARRRCEAAQNVTLQQSGVLDYRAEQPFDLITCSEMLHYLWVKPELPPLVCAHLKSLLAPGGHLVLVYGQDHFRFEYERDFRAHGFRVLKTEDYQAAHRDYRITVLTV